MCKVNPQQPYLGRTMQQALAPIYGRWRCGDIRILVHSPLMHCAGFDSSLGYIVFFLFFFGFSRGMNVRC